MTPTDVFVRARAFLLDHREDYDKAYREFTWPTLPVFNWALDWFDVFAQGNRRPALWIIRDRGDDVKVTFAELSERSSRVANYLRSLGVARGDRVLMMLPNVLPIWELMLAAMKLGATIIPASTQLTPEDVRGRIARGSVRHVLTDTPGSEKISQVSGEFTRIVVDGPATGFLPYEDALSAPAHFDPDAPTRAEDPLLLYFTSGTTAKPKLVLHTHQSYPIGHLSTMYWIGIKEGDVHQNISSPGWAKHAWSSFFAPWNAGATVVMHDYARFSAQRSLAVLRDTGVNTLCAPPTVWRMMIVDALGGRPPSIRELASAGEPLNPQVIEHVRTAWGVTIGDGYGHGNDGADRQHAGAGRAPRVDGPAASRLPGSAPRRRRARSERRGNCLAAVAAPAGLMARYVDDAERTASATAAGHYRTGDEVVRDDDGYFHYVGRGDDVFKSSDYRISPFELESVLIDTLRWRRWPSCRVRIPCGRPCPRPTSRSSLEPGRARSSLGRSWPSHERSWRPTRHPAPGVRRASEDDLRQDPWRGAANQGTRTQRERGSGRARAPHGRLRGEALNSSEATGRTIRFPWKATSTARRQTQDGDARPGTDCRCSASAFRAVELARRYRSLCGTRTGRMFVPARAPQKDVDCFAQVAQQPQPEGRRQSLLLQVITGGSRTWPSTDSSSPRRRPPPALFVLFVLFVTRMGDVCGTLVDAPLGERRQLLVGCLLLVQRLLEEIRRSRSCPMALAHATSVP